MNRIAELAIEALEMQKAAVEAEIESLRALLKRSGSKGAGSTKGARPRKRRPRTPEERQAHSERMRAYWKKRKAEAAKKTK